METQGIELATFVWVLATFVAIAFGIFLVLREIQKLKEAEGAKIVERLLNDGINVDEHCLRLVIQHFKQFTNQPRSTLFCNLARQSVELLEAHLPEVLQAEHDRIVEAEKEEDSHGAGT